MGEILCNESYWTGLEQNQSTDLRVQSTDASDSRLFAPKQSTVLGSFLECVLHEFGEIV